MNPLITIVVPVYNVEKYLDRCLESITNQSYRNLQIILVDDGSPDASGKICDAWAKQDSRILSLHQKNSGPSVARNYGVQYAKGEYISFIDSDDYVLPEYIEYLYTLLTEHDADISCCGREFSYGIETVTSIEENKRLNSVQIHTAKEMNQIHGTNSDSVSACCKLYKTQLVIDHPFPEGQLHEDKATTYRIFYDTPKTVVSDRKLYIYFQGNSTSITHTFSPKRLDDMIKTHRDRIKFYKQAGDAELVNIAWNDYVYYITNFSAENRERINKDKLEEIKANEVFPILQSNNKLRLILCLISPGLCNLFLKIYSSLKETDKNK